MGMQQAHEKVCTAHMAAAELKGNEPKSALQTKIEARRALAGKQRVSVPKQDPTTLNKMTAQGDAANQQAAAARTELADASDRYDDYHAYDDYDDDVDETHHRNHASSPPDDVPTRRIVPPMTRRRRVERDGRARDGRG